METKCTCDGGRRRTTEGGEEDEDIEIGQHKIAGEQDIHIMGKTRCRGRDACPNWHQFLHDRRHGAGYCPLQGKSATFWDVARTGETFNIEFEDPSIARIAEGIWGGI